LTPASYLMGSLYYQGIMTGYGVDLSSFPIGINSTYVYSYFAALDLFTSFTGVLLALLKELFTPPKLYTTLLFVVCFTVAIYLLFLIAKHPEKWQPVKESGFLAKIIDYFHWENNAFSAAVGVTGFVSGSFFAVIYVVFFVFVLWWGVPYASFYKGKLVSKKDVARYMEKGCYFPDGELWNTCTTVFDENKNIVYKGISIAESRHRIAILDREGSHVLELQENYTIGRRLKNNKDNITSQ